MDFNISRSQYLDHPHNGTITNERCIEVPIAQRFLNEYFHEDKFIEVGAVLPYYINSEHRCIDPVDKMATESKFAQEIDFSGLRVLSVSTIEHIGRGDYKLKKNKNLAFKVLKNIYEKSENCLISFPIGYNKVLDNAIKESKELFNFIFHKRTEECKWEVSECPSNFNTKYGKPFTSGNAIIWIFKL